MAELEGHSLASAFPSPPPFWKDFTAEKLARLEELRREYGANKAPESDDESATERLPGLPEDLTNLQPPPEPTDGRWRVFGDLYRLEEELPSLEEQGITKLASGGPAAPSREAKHYDRALELKRMAKSLLLNFLQLVGTLPRNPTQARDKIDHLRTVLINMHHTLNEYRPHQARESAIEMMQDHLDRTRAETLAVGTQVDKARALLEGLASLGLEPPTGSEAALLRAPDRAQEREGRLAERAVETAAAADAAFG